MAHDAGRGAPADSVANVVKSCGKGDLRVCVAILWESCKLNALVTLVAMVQAKFDGEVQGRAETHEAMGNIGLSWRKGRR